MHTQNYMKIHRVVVILSLDTFTVNITIEINFSDAFFDSSKLYKATDHFIILEVDLFRSTVWGNHLAQNRVCLLCLSSPLSLLPPRPIGSSEVYDTLSL